MSYTGLVHWYAGVTVTAGRRPTPRVPLAATATPVMLPDIPDPARERPGDGSATPSYGGLAGWYAAVVLGMERQEATRVATPVALPSLPHAA